MDRDTDGYKRLRGLIAVMSVVIIAMGVVMFANAHSFNNQLKQQKADSAAAQKATNKCILDNFTDLVASLKVRGSLTQRDADNTSSVILKVATASSASDGPAVSRALAQYRVDFAKTKAVRADTPIPDFPKGTCDHE